MTPKMNLSIQFAPHAVRRYRDRLRPGLSVERAEIDLQRITAHARVSSRAPEWLGGSSRQDITMFLTIADASFPLTPSADGTFLVALTCRVRGSLSASVRESRKRRACQGHHNSVSR